jgi:four helix bundle protein
MADAKGRNIRSYRELAVYQLAFDSAMSVFELSKTFPKEERYSLIDQIRRSSRSVAVNLVEAWRKRRYPAAFVSKLSDAETEAAETQAWLEFAVKCGYVSRAPAAQLYRDDNKVLGMLVTMIRSPESWQIRQPKSNT